MGEAKNFNVNNSGYTYDQNELIIQEKEKKDKQYREFINRIESFKDITTLREAKALASKIIPVANKINYFNIGNAKCTVINKEDLFRICVDNNKEFICYDFV